MNAFMEQKRGGKFCYSALQWLFIYLTISMQSGNARSDSLVATSGLSLFPSEVETL